MSELLFLVLVAVSAGFCFWPFFRRQAVETLSTRDTPLGRVEQRKETLLQNIADLDFEFSMGKLSDEDHQALRGTLKGQAAEAIEQIDVLEESEAMIGRRTHASSKTSTPARSEAPPPAASPASSAPKFCSSCGTALTPGARFCSSCGHSAT